MANTNNKETENKKATTDALSADANNGGADQGAASASVSAIKVPIVPAPQPKAADHPFARAITFVLEHIEKHGDGPQSTAASKHLAAVKAELDSEDGDGGDDEGHV